MKLYLTLALAVTAGGCGSSRSVVKTSDGLSLSAMEVVRNVQDMAQTSHSTLQIQADLSIRSPAFNGSVRAEISHRRGDSLFASLSASALRIEAGRLWTTPDSFFYYDRLEKQVVYGPVAFMSQLVPGLFSGDDLFERLLGLLAPDADELWTVEYASAQYALRSEDSLTRYVIDPALWRVVLLERRTPDGAVLESLLYPEFASVQGMQYPKRVILQRPGEGVAVSAHFRAVVLDPDGLDFSLRVPPDVPWVHARDLLPVQGGQ